MPSSLCTVCRGIDYSKPCHGPEYKACGSGFSIHLFYPNHSSVECLEDSAEASGCELCSLILATIKDSAIKVFDEDEWEHADNLLIEAGLDPTETNGSDGMRATHAGIFSNSTGANIDPLDVSAPIVLEIVFREPLPDESPSRCTDISVHWTQVSPAKNESTRQRSSNISLISGISADLSTLLESRDVKRDTHTGSLDSLNLARFWLEACDSGHQKCSERAGPLPPMLPTRVIDVGNETQQPHLHISAQGQRHKYVCLSHCWGTGKQFKSETSTVKARQRGINLEEMPKTFQDAVHATRHLGFRYLWIDSLCILQDSRDDWQHEAKDMGRYYHGASLTIFALDAKGDEEGFYHARDRGTMAPCRTPMFDDLVRIMKGEPDAVSYVQRISRHRFGVPPSLRDHLFEKPNAAFVLSTYDQSILNTRGWTLQEWLLAPRSLVFGSAEIQWICHSTSACDCVPEGQSNLPGSPSTPTVDGNRDPEGLTPETVDHSQHWMKVAEDFTKRNLTFGKDKLPALAGIASEFSKKHKPGDYLAGLWRDKLRTYLSWYASTLQATAPTSRPPQYRAPSWSWASVDGKLNVVVYEPADSGGTEEGSSQLRWNALLCDILDCWTVPRSSANHFGEVVAGALVLRCRIRQAAVREEKKRGGASVVPGPRLTVYDKDTDQDLGGLDPDDTTCRLAGSDVWCVPLTSFTSGNLHCLALGPATAEEILEAEKFGRVEKPVFKRLGVVQEQWGKLKPGMKSMRRYVVLESGMVDYDVNEDRSTIGALLDWFEAAAETVITII